MYIYYVVHYFPSYITSSTSSVVSLKYVTKHGPPLHHIIIYHNTSQMHIYIIYIYELYIYTVHIEHYWTCKKGSDVISGYHWCINWHGHWAKEHLSQHIGWRHLQSLAQGNRDLQSQLLLLTTDDGYDGCTMLYRSVQICTVHVQICLAHCAKPLSCSTRLMIVNVYTHDHTLYTTCYIYIFWQLFSLGTGDGRCLRLTLRSSRVKETSKASWATWHRAECA